MAIETAPDADPATGQELRRAFAFMQKADMGATTKRPFAFGTAFVTPSLPKRHDSNYLLVERLPDDVTAPDLAAEAERVLGAAGLDHRVLVLYGDAEGARLARGFSDLGWSLRRQLVMAHHRQPRRSPDLSLVKEVDERAVRSARRKQMSSYPWGTPKAVSQILDGKLLIARSVDVRFFAVELEGRVVSYADLYSDGATAQIEDVATLEQYRDRGYASAVVLAAVEAARRGGNDLVFLVADEDDWPKELYRKLGFDAIGRFYKFIRATSGRPE